MYYGAMSMTFIGYILLLNYLITGLDFGSWIAQRLVLKPYTNNVGKIGRAYVCIENCSCVDDPKTGYVFANCSHKNIVAIPATFPQKLIYLDLSYNNISEIAGRHFRSLVDLRILILSYNRIAGLANGSFIGLAKLTDMYLNGNMIPLTNESYPPLSFEGLRDLRVLHLETKVSAVSALIGLVYPDKALSLLDQLTELHMNGIPFSHFGSGFLKLRKLSKLSVSGHKGYCSILKLGSNAFENLKLSHLTYLDLSLCRIANINKTTFSHLRWIDMLDLTENVKLGFPRMSQCIYGLVNTSIKTLKLTRIRVGYKIVAKNEYFKFFPNLTLTHLYLDHNGIQAFDQSFADWLPKTLEYLNIARNTLRSSKSIKEVYKLTNLRTVNGSCQSWDTQARQVLFTQPKFQDYNLPNKSANKVSHVDNIVKYDVGLSAFRMPPKLEYIYYRASKLHYPIMSHSFTKNIIKHLDLSDNLITALIGPIEGAEHLKYVDLSGNSAFIVSNVFFANMYSIEVLLLEKNRFAESLQKDEDGHIFQDLTNLKLLNLGMNGIKYVPKRIFKNQSNLTQLFLNDNAIRDLNIKLDHMLNLEYLDFSQNIIITIDTGMLQAIDKLARIKNLSVNLQNNTLECSCSSIDLLQWLDSTPVVLIHKDDYKCKFANNSIISLGSNLQHVIHTLQLQCIAPTVLLIGSILLLTVASIITMAAIIRHKKIQMGYYLYRFLDRINLFQTAQEIEPLQRRDYDVFLSFHSNLSMFIKNIALPELEINRRFEVCIGQREIMPGTLPTAEIYRVVHYSRKTLAFITRDYVQNEDSRTELKIAFIDSAHSGNVKLIPVFMEDIVFDGTDRWTSKILTSLRSISYNNYDNDGAFLEALVREITERY